MVDSSPAGTDKMMAAVEKARSRVDASRRTVALIEGRIAALSGPLREVVCVHCGEADPTGIGPQIAAAEAELESARHTLAEDEEDLAGALAFQAQAVEARRQAEAQARAAEQQRAAEALAAAEARRATEAEASRQAMAKQQAEAQARAVAAEKVARLARARDALAAAERRNADLHADHEKALARHYADGDRLTAAARDAARVRDEHAALPVPEIPAPPSAEEEAEIRAELAAITAADEARATYRAHVQAVADAEAKAASTKATWDATRALVSAIRQARDDLAAAAYGPIQAAARSLLEGHPELPVPYFAGVDDFGAVNRHGKRVGFAALGDSEQAMTATAFAFAFTVVSRCRVRIVLLDRLDAVAIRLRPAVMAALVRARQAGEVDNVVVTVHTTTEAEIESVRVPGATVAVLDAPSAAVAA